MNLQASLLSVTLPLPFTQNCFLIGFRALVRFRDSHLQICYQLCKHTEAGGNWGLRSEISVIQTTGFSTGFALWTSLGSCHSQQSHADAGCAFRLSSSTHIFIHEIGCCRDFWMHSSSISFLGLLLLGAILFFVSWRWMRVGVDVEEMETAL